MRTTLLRLANSTEFAPRRSFAVLALILLVVTICSALQAIAQPFWFDEICTVILCRLPSASNIWSALEDAADTNPPVFYFVTRLTKQLVWDDHLGSRLPAILGLLATVFFIYSILSKRVSRLSALVGAAFVLCTPVAAYGYEARPYALMLGCISCAIFAWQRINDSRLYSLLLAGTLAAAVSLHYYAILVWPAFLMAEASELIFQRRFRVSSWAALLAGALPLAYFAPLLLKLQQYYGQNFWAKPRIMDAFFAHNWLFPFGSNWGVLLAVGITVIFLYFNITKSNQGAVSTLPIAEQTLTLMLLWLPVIAVAATKISQGGMTSRYMLPTILGGALALGYVVDKMPISGRLLLLILLLMNYSLSSLSVVKGLIEGSLPGKREAAVQQVQSMASQLHNESALPIVISDGLRYLPMAYYQLAEPNSKLYAIADPMAAATLSDNKSDSLDLALLVLRRYFPLQVEDYDGFVSKHREFLLILGGGPFDWWPARLAQDGHMLRLLSARGGTKVYKVTVKPK